MVSSDARHPAEKEFLAFMERKDILSGYVHTSAGWLKEKYPGSAQALLPKLRQIYRDKIREGQ